MVALRFFQPFTLDSHVIRSTIQIVPRLPEPTLLAEVLVEPNTLVQKDEPLYRFDDTVYRLQVQAAQAALTAAEQNARILQEDVTRRGLVANYQNTVLAAYSEVENAMVAYKAARSEAAYLQQSVDASRRAAEIAVSQYTDGVADYTRVLNTQRAALAAEANLVEARSSVSENLVALYKALGGGWQIRRGREYLPDEVLVEMAYRTDWGDLLSEDVSRRAIGRNR